MAPCYTSHDGQMISTMYSNLRYSTREKCCDMNRDTYEAFISNLNMNIREIDDLLRYEAVRGHLDVSHRTPEVDESCSINKLLRRLKKQVHAASVLADVCHQGPPANEDEQFVLTEIRRTLCVLYDTVSSIGSHKRSATATNSVLTTSLLTCSTRTYMGLLTRKHSYELFLIQIFINNERFGTCQHRTANPSTDYVGLRLDGEVEVTGIEFSHH